MQLTLIANHPDIAILRAGPDLSQQTAGSAGLFEWTLGKDAQHRRVLVDLSDVVTFDSSGLAWLMASTKRFREAGGKVVFYALPTPLADIVQFMRIGHLLHLARDENEARSLALEGPPPS